MLFSSHQNSDTRHNLVLGLLLLVGLAGLIVIFQTPANLYLTPATALVVVVCGYIYYYIDSMRHIEYRLDDNGLTIICGCKTIILPYQYIVEVDQLAQVNPVPFYKAGWLLGSIGYFKGCSEGIIHSYATSRDDVVLIKSTRGMFLLSPSQVEHFISILNVYWNERNCAHSIVLKQPSSFLLWKSKQGIMMIGVNIVALLGMVLAIELLNQSVLFNDGFRGGTDWYGSPRHLYYTHLPAVLVILGVFTGMADYLSRRGIREGVMLLAWPIVCTLVVLATLLVTI